MLFEPTRLRMSDATGMTEGATGRYEKRLSDLRGLYGDAAAFEAEIAVGDRLVYEVREFRPSEAAGDLIFGSTRIVPGRIGQEYFLTRGHIHKCAGRPEIYIGRRGHGVMLMESPQGEARTIEILPQTACYVPPYWIHRSVNVGSDDLVMEFCYPADAGQDYAVIERSGGMRHRVVADATGGWALAPNPAYRPRTAPEIARLLAATGQPG